MAFGAVAARHLRSKRRSVSVATAFPADPLSSRSARPCI